MNWTPTEHDIRVARLLDQELGPIRFIEVIHHEENRMTDVVDTTASEDSGWENEGAGAPAFGGATYPEYPYSLADHVYTWSPKLPDGSMLVIRSQSADGLVKAVKEMGPLAGQLRAAWQDVVGTPQAAPQQFQTPQTPPPFGPNVSAPAAPGYQGPPAQQWTPPQAQAAPAWGGGQAQAQQRKEYPAPQGWYKLNVPFPGGKDQLHALAAQLQIPKGSPSKGGKYNFFGLNPQGQPGKAWYCDPQVVQAFQQFSPMVG